MALPDNVIPSKLEDQLFQKRIDEMTQRGELRFSAWAKHSRPPSGWNLQSFMDYTTKETPAVPEFAGAAAPMAWLKLAKDDIGAAEGNVPYAYHGALSAARLKERKFRVTPGDSIGTDEVSIGYGFNLTQPGGRQLYEKALAGADAPGYDDVLHGRKTINPAQAQSLQEYMILEKNAALERQLEGTPLRDHQRAALVSMLYQGVGTKDIVAAIKAGKSDREVAEMIRKTGNPRFATRRALEASRFLGAKAVAQADNSTNQIPGRKGGPG